MAVTGVSVYTTTVLAIYEDALRLIKVLGEGESASTAMKTDDLSLVEKYFKSLSAYDLTLWKVETVSVTLVENQASYQFGEGSSVSTALPINMTDVMYRDDTDATDPQDTYVTRLTRDEYMRLPNKLESGQPTQWYYERLRTVGDLYVWPVPDADVAGLKIYVKYTTYLDNITAISTAEIDVPSEWLETVTYGLAVRLSRPYGIELLDRIDLRKEYKEMLETLLDHDREEGSVYLQPSERMKWRR